MTLNRRLLLVGAPKGALAESDFATDTTPIPTPGPGEVLCRNILLSIDPAGRAWMSQPTYREQLEPGEVMAGYTISEVVAENGADVALGQLVFGSGGWQEYAVLPAREVMPITVRAELPVHLSVLGITGLTAYFGLMRVGRPRAGQTVVVSAAAGATGNVVGQLARMRGCRIVGIAGTPEKCELLVDSLGFDAAVSHRSPNLRDDLRAACPDGVDVYFDNVGGPVLSTVLRQLNQHGCVVCCGSVSAYDEAPSGGGDPAIPGLLVTRRLRMEGFLVHDYESEWPAAEAELAAAVENGELTALHELVDGLEQAPSALIGVLHGGNVGKRMVRVGPDPG